MNINDGIYNNDENGLAHGFNRIKAPNAWIECSYIHGSLFGLLNWNCDDGDSLKYFYVKDKIEGESIGIINYKDEMLY